jgi:hypothetical protein
MGPSRILCVVSTVNEFQEQASVLKAEIPNTEAALLFGEASFVPADQALSARNGILAGPQEGPPTHVQDIYHPGRKLHSAHGIDRQAVEHGIDKDKASLVIEEASPPPCEVLIYACDDWSVGSKVQLLIG